MSPLLSHVVACLSFSLFITTGLCQKKEPLLQQSCDSVRNKLSFSYLVTMQHQGNLQDPADSLRVIIERSSKGALASSYIIQTDTAEIIFDGKFGFIVDHLKKSVRQVNTAMIRQHMLFSVSQLDFFSNYCKWSPAVNGKPMLEKSGTSVFNLKSDTKNHIVKIGIRNDNKLPQFINVRQTNRKVIQYKFTHYKFTGLLNPATHIAKYIDSYSLLALETGVFENTRDARDSLLGKPAPDFILNDLSGKQVSLRDFKGKLVLLDFWEVWCGPCRMSMTNLEQLQERYGNNGLIIIGISKDNPDMVKKFVKGKAVTYTNVLGNEKISNDYRVLEIPQYYLINEEGVIIYVSKNGFEKKIEELILHHFR